MQKKMTVQNTTKNTKDWPIQTPVITGCEIICVKRQAIISNLVVNLI